MRELKGMGFTSIQAATQMKKDGTQINRAWIFPTYRSYKENNRNEPVDVYIPGVIDEDEPVDTPVDDDLLDLGDF